MMSLTAVMKQEVQTMAIINDSTYGSFPNMTFADVWDEADKFVTGYRQSGLDVPDIPTEILTQLYYLLYATYGNSPMANNDEYQFMYRVYSTIYMYGPTWYKRLETQENLRTMNMDDLMYGGKAIYNTALHDGSLPSTATLEELPGINQQNTTNYKKSKAQAYETLMNLLRTDVTKEFLDKFKKLFMPLASNPNARYYVTEVNNDGN